MKNTSLLRTLALGFAVAGMGVSMPSCPGQQAMQEQLDAMKIQQTADGKKLQAIDTAVKGMKADVDAIKAAAAQMGDMGNQAKMMSDKLTQLEADVKAIKEAPRGGSSAGAAKGKKRK